MPDPGEAERKNPAIPLGLRAAILFLWVVIVGLVFLILFAVLGVVSGLLAGALADDPFPEGVVVSILAVTAFAILAAMLSGAVWLAMHLESQPTGIGVRHPARMIILPAVGIVRVCGFVAVAVWIPSLFLNGFSETFPWPLVWGAIGSGAFLLYRHLDRILPK
jgi:hypothetical protein